MPLIIRAWNLARGLASRLVSAFERRNPEALLELEKENLRTLVGRFNEGLVSHATLSERLKMQVVRGETKAAENTGRMQALIKAGETRSAGRYALQLKETSARLAEDRTQLAAAEETFAHLVRTRDLAVAEAKAKIEQLRWQIGDLKANRALAELQTLAGAMIDGLDGPGDSLNRLQEMVSEEQEKARGRARVTAGSFSSSDLAMKEAEQSALEAQALDEFLTKEAAAAPGEPLALPNYVAGRGGAFGFATASDRSREEGGKP
jgi:hypothetical protein